MHYKGTIRLFNRFQNGFCVERDNRADINDFNLGFVFGWLFFRLHEDTFVWRFHK